MAIDALGPTSIEKWYHPRINCTRVSTAAESLRFTRRGESGAGLPFGYSWRSFLAEFDVFWLQML